MNPQLDSVNCSMESETKHVNMLRLDNHQLKYIKIHDLNTVPLWI